MRVVVANAFLVGLVGWTLFASRQQYESQAILTTQNLAQSLELNVSGVLDKISIGVGVVTVEAERELASGGIGGPVLDDYLRRAQAQLPEIDAIRLTDAAGDVRPGPQDPPGAQINLADRDYFQQARRLHPGEALLSQPLASRRNGRWAMMVARAIHAPDGHFAGIAFGELPLEYFTRLFAPLDIGPGGLLWVRMADLALVARKPAFTFDGGGIGSRSVSQRTMEMVRDSKESASYISTAAVDGVERRVSLRRVHGWPLYILVGEARADYLAPWRKEAGVLATMAALFLLVSVWWARGAYRTRRAELAAIERLRSSKEISERSETRFRTLYDATSDAVMLLGHQGYVDCNRAALDLFGLPDKESLRHGTSGVQLSPAKQPCGTDSRLLAEQRVAEAFDKGSLRFEWLHRRVDTGAMFPTEVLLTRMTLDGMPLLQSVVRDITDRRRAEEQIRYLAYFDALTKLPNRRLLLDRLAQALLSCRRTRQFGVLMILDLDNFKGLNDTRGHDVGDHLLVEVAQRIVACVRQEDTVARLGGDEYVVLAEGLGEDEAMAAGQAEQIASKIGRMLSLPSRIPGSGEAHHSTASVGLTLFNSDAISIEVLLKQADVALYQAKAAGRNAVRFFNPQMQSAIEARAAMEAALRSGLSEGHFTLYYQPQFDAGGCLTGAEALLRWMPPGRSMVSPAEFIPIAEDNGLIIPIGLWVLQTACEQLRAWSGHEHTRGLMISVNVSPRQFRQADFAEQVRTCLERSGADPGRLKIELTESVVLDNVGEVIERMQRMRTMGVSFSLDDFGTGFSSLSYLKRLPLDQVKIDQSFVRDVVSDPNDGAIVRAIVAMSRSLGIEVMAEGVETAEQLAFLKACGCEHYQGYLFGRPLPIGQWDQFLRLPLVATP